MKGKILKTALTTILFLLFLIGWILELIVIIGYLKSLSSGTFSYVYIPSLNVEIPSVVYRLFGTFLILSTIGSYIGYKSIYSIINLIKEYNKTYADKIAAQKAARAEAKKQARIAQLQADLEELKKD